MSIQKIILSLLTVAVIVSGILFYQSQNKEVLNSNNQIKSNVKIGYRSTMLAGLPYHVAKTQGFFSKQGLSIEEIPLSTSNMAIEALVKGDVDISFATTLQNALPVENLTPGKFKIFSHSINTTNYDALLVKSDSNISNISQLKNKKIGVLTGTTATNIVKATFKSQNIDLDKTEFVQLTPDLQLNALETGSIDGLLAYEPTLSIGIKTSKFKKIMDNLAFPKGDEAVSIAIISQDFINKNPELAKKTIAAFDESNNLIGTNSNKTREILAKEYKLEQDIANKLSFINFSTSDKINPAKVQEYSDYLFSIGELKTKPEIDKLMYKN
jgi:NitT/TauT family transport system substrate-binding protein